MSTSAPLRVVLVEDNLDDVVLLRESFADHRAVRFELSVARSLAEALELLEAELPDCVLLDLGLPDAGGLDGLERLRGAAPDVPVLVLTGLRDDAVALAALELGASDYLVKGSLTPVAIVRAVRDAAERRARTTALRLAEERFRHAFSHAAIGMALVAPDGRWIQVNQRLCDLLGYPEPELRTMTFQDITHPDDLRIDVAHVAELLADKIPSYEMEKRYVRSDGTLVWALLSVSLVRDDAGEPLYFVSQILDISQRKQLEADLRHLADHDALTGLLNRRRFAEALAHQLHRASRYDERAALLLFDLDRFKQVNDSRGHAAGDELLRTVATAVRRRLRVTDLVARLGGDEFAVLLPHIDRARAERVASELGEVIAREAAAAGLPVTASIGVAVVDPGAPPSPDDLLGEADAAMYEAKNRAREASRAVAG